MSTVRLRRLAADYDKLWNYVRLHPRVNMIQVDGDPPEKYQLQYQVKSFRQRGDEVELAKDHIVEITLPRNYPRTPPQCRMLTPVFHPNIAPHAICVGDHWSAGESLESIVIRIGEMLAYQSYNLKSPLNGEAAKWVESHLEQLPSDEVCMLPEEEPEAPELEFEEIIETPPMLPPAMATFAPPPIPAIDPQPVGPVLPAAVHLSPGSAASTAPPEQRSPQDSTLHTNPTRPVSTPVRLPRRPVDAAAPTATSSNSPATNNAPAGPSATGTTASGGSAADAADRIPCACPGCGKSYKVPSEYLGRWVRCSSCDTRFQFE